MFTLPHEPGNREDIQVISVTEDSKTLDCVLRMCYPVVDRPIPSFEIACSSFKAALKYDMDLATSICKTNLRNYAVSQPLRLYAVACTVEDDELAGLAAERFRPMGNWWGSRGNVEIDLESFLARYVLEFEEIPAGCYYRLVQYLRTGRKQGFVHPAPTPSAPVSPSRTVDDPPSRMLIYQDNNPASCPNDGNADLVMITSDRMRIPVSKAVVTLASPVLSKMLRESQARGDNVNHDSLSPRTDIPVLHVDEDSLTMKPLIQLCYPTAAPDNVSMKLILQVFLAAKKYEMARAIWHLHHQWSQLLSTEPLRAFLLAITLDWKTEACTAARALLSWTYQELEDAYTPEFETTPAGPYHRLLRYHKKCGELAAELKLDDVDSWKRIAYCNVDKCNVTARWKSNHSERIARRLRIRPSAAALSETEILTGLVNELGSCFTCKRELGAVLSFHTDFGRLVEYTIAKVRGQRTGRLSTMTLQS